MTESPENPQKGSPASEVSPTADTKPREIPAYAGRYVAECLPQIVNDEGIVQLRLPEKKTKREIYIVDFPSGKSYVMRAFDKLSRLKHYGAAMAATHDKPQLPLAPPIHADARNRTKSVYRRWFCVEDFVEGTHFDPATSTPEHEEAILRALAALHAETSPRWGRLDKLRTGAYNTRLLTSIGRIFEQIGNLPTGPSFGELGLWHGWFAYEIELMAEPTAFSLIHQHLVPDNIILSPDGARATFLGTGHLRLGHWAQDVEQVAALLSRKDPRRRADIIARYMALQTHLPAGTEYDAIATVFRARYQLLRLRSLLKRKSKGEKIPEARFAEILRNVRDFIR